MDWQIKFIVALVSLVSFSVKADLNRLMDEINLSSSAQQNIRDQIAQKKFHSLPLERALEEYIYHRHYRDLNPNQIVFIDLTINIYDDRMFLLDFSTGDTLSYWSGMANWQAHPSRYCEHTFGNGHMNGLHYNGPFMFSYFSLQESRKTHQIVGLNLLNSDAHLDDVAFHENTNSARTVFRKKGIQKPGVFIQSCRKFLMALVDS